MQNNQSHPPFYQQLIGLWEKVSRKEPLNAVEIVNQVIRNNSFLLNREIHFFIRVYTTNEFLKSMIS